MPKNTPLSHMVFGKTINKIMLTMFVISMTALRDKKYHEAISGRYRNYFPCLKFCPVALATKCKTMITNIAHLIAITAGNVEYSSENWNNVAEKLVRNTRITIDKKLSTIIKCYIDYGKWIPYILIFYVSGSSIYLATNP